jgi:hypothetical protein
LYRGILDGGLMHVHTLYWWCPLWFFLVSFALSVCAIEFWFFLVFVVLCISLDAANYWDVWFCLQPSPFAVEIVREFYIIMSKLLGLQFCCLHFCNTQQHAAWIICIWSDSDVWLESRYNPLDCTFAIHGNTRKAWIICIWGDSDDAKADTIHNISHKSHLTKQQFICDTGAHITYSNHLVPCVGAHHYSLSGHLQYTNIKYHLVNHLKAIV